MSTFDEPIGQPALPWGDLSHLPIEVARYRVGPDRMFNGRPCSISVVEYVRICSDACPLPRFDLFPRLSRLARWVLRAT